jgi:hypothetical protein
MAKKRKLTLWFYEPHDMACLKEGRKELFLGNFWDFHAGCMGTEFEFADGTVINFDKQWTENIRSPLSVAQMVANEIGATIEIKHRKTPFDC